MKILALIYNTIISLRNFLYDRGVFKIHKVRKPVIAVGNLTVGGTGKSPFVIYLVDLLKKHSIKPAVVSRGYKSQIKDMAFVDLTHPRSATVYGDEPVLIAKQVRVPVVVSPNRVKACEALTSKDIQVIIADDAFQHRRLHRDLNIALVDATEELKNYQVLPVGRLREPLKNLSRADVIVVTKLNLLEDSGFWVSWFEGLIKNFNLTQKIILKMSYGIESLYTLVDHEALGFQHESLKNTVALSGLANPSSFEQSLKSSGIKFKKHYKFNDHHIYSENELLPIINESLKLGQKIIITEKDAVKIEALQINKGPFIVTKLGAQLESFRPNTNKEEFFEKLDDLFS